MGIGAVVGTAQKTVPICIGVRGQFIPGGLVDHLPKKIFTTRPKINKLIKKRRVIRCTEIGLHEVKIVIHINNAIHVIVNY